MHLIQQLLCLNLNTACSTCYLILCKKCGLQYVGGTSQLLHCGFKIIGLVLNLQCNSDGHSIEDLNIIPDCRECDDDCLSQHAKTRSREEYWCWGFILPCGLNGSVKRVRIS